MELPLLVRISSSPLWLLLTLVGLTVLLHFFFVWKWQLKDVMWKYADYVWLFVAALGGLAASGKAGQFIAANVLDGTVQPKTEMSYKMLRGDIKTGALMACMPLRRGPESPANFDEIYRAQQDICQQYKKLDAEMPDSIKEPFPPLEKLNFHPINGDERYVKTEIEMANRSAATYGQDVAEYTQLTQKKKSSDAEDFFIAMGPLLLAFAVAVRITKSSGEIKNAKHKQATE
jgi:hypothetical protein